MTWLIIILISLVVAGLFMKFIDKLANIAILLVGLMFLGIVIIPFNMKVGIYVSVWSFCILLLAGVVFLFSSFISAIVVGPLFMIWTSLKNLFK